MSKNLRQLVSKKKKRYDDGEFNLDLSYITKQIIAMGVPAQTLERFYRNDIDDVARFLEQRHSERYKVYNLCAERAYNQAKFKNRVEAFSMQDHNPPLIHIIPYFCASVYKWLQNGTDYVAAVHCKAGKGRTGVMICCYLLYETSHGRLSDEAPVCNTADQALAYYGEKRTHNNKGVTIPSQKRYVYYYSHLLRHELVVENVGLVLKSVTVEGGLPAFPPSGTCCLQFRCKKLVRDCHQQNRSAHMPIGECEPSESRRGASGIVLLPPAPIPVNGDVQIAFYNKSRMLPRLEKVFHFWFNTFFVLHQPCDTPGARWRQLLAEGVKSSIAPQAEPNDLFLTLTKQELDKACKDVTHKVFPEEFTVTLQFGRPQYPSDEFNIGGVAAAGSGGGGAGSTGAAGTAHVPFRSFSYSDSASTGQDSFGRLSYSSSSSSSSSSGCSCESDSAADRRQQPHDCNAASADIHRHADDDKE